MPNIEILENSSTRGMHLSIDGREAPESKVTLGGDDRPRWYYLDIVEEFAVNAIKSIPLPNIRTDIERISLPYPSIWQAGATRLFVGKTVTSGEFDLLDFDLVFKADEWTRPWSIAQLRYALQEAFSADEIPGVLIDAPGFPFEGVSICCKVLNRSGTIEGEAIIRERQIRPIIARVVDHLSTKATKNTLVTAFNFPQEVAAACEQYLIYFGQFLSDLGVNAKVNINHEANRVLFSVVPDNQTEALESISSALNSYLCLPGNPEFKAHASSSKDISVLQLQSNVSQFESQIALSYAVIQAKDATIQAQNETIRALQLSNFRLEQDLSMRAAPMSVPPVVAKPNAESVIDGVLSVKDAEIKGLVIHFPEMIRRMKRRFGRNR